MWGNEKHYTLPDVEWGYGSIVGDRDINEHDFKFAWEVAWAEVDRLPAERLVEIMAEKTIPYTGDPFMFDYSEGPTGIYSENKAKLVAWHRHYSRFWKQSVLYCDWIWANFINPNNPDLLGYTPEGEPKFFNAVTGKNMSFADGVEIGRKIWNLDRAIWILQGRHRDMEKFAGYVRKMPHFGVVPAYVDGKWSIEQRIVTLDEARVEEWKTHYYKLEGWDTSSGWPSRSTLEGLDLGYVADKLESVEKLGASGTYTEP
jgi:aldehyde:ferredoxin oxidoreductase